MVSIGGVAVNLAWAMLALVCIYLLTVVGSVLRGATGKWYVRRHSDSPAPVFTTSFVLVRKHIKIIIGAIAGGLGIVAVVMNPMNIYAVVVAGLGEQVAMVWGIFTAGVLSGTNAITLTDLSLIDVGIASSAIALAALVLDFVDSAFSPRGEATMGRKVVMFSIVTFIAFAAVSVM